MGFINDIATISKSMSSLKDIAKSRESKSFAKGALDNTVQFPNLIASSIEIPFASVSNKMLEQVYTAFVQIYLSVNNTIDISVDSSPSQFMKKLHQNIKLESSAIDLYYEHCMEPDDYYDNLMEKVYNGTTKVLMNDDQTRAMVFSVVEKANSDVYKSFMENNIDILDSIDVRPFPNVSNNPFYTEKDDEISIPKFSNKGSDDYDEHVIKKSIEAKATQSTEVVKSLLSDKIKVPVITQADVKKLNDMQPYQIQVRLMAINDRKEFVQYMDFILGVKVNLHVIKSEEMIKNIVAVLENNGKFFNFVRWTTGEKSLVKDLLLNINNVKIDVSNRTKGNSAWWITLKRLKEEAKAQKAFMARHQFVPNSTMSISSYEYDVIKDQFGYDLRSTKIAKKLMDDLFLMNFMIIDEGRRTIDVLYDSASTFLTYSIESLEREVTMNSNKLGRELTRMISG